MPLGLFSAMKPWKPTIRHRKSSVVVAFGLKTSRKGSAYSVAVPSRDMSLASGDGRRSSGNDAKSRFFSALREERSVVHHELDHGREVVVDLRGRRPEPDEAPHELAARDPERVAARDDETRQRHPVVLGAGGQEERLVEHAHDRDQQQRRKQEIGRDLRRDERAQQEELVRGVDADVEPAPLVAADRGRAGEERKLRRPRPQEVAEASGHRLEARVHRPPRAAEAGQLVEDRPRDRLLERRRREGPRRAAR